MGFKEDFQEDIDNVFFDTNEFAIIVNFCGIELLGIKSITKFEKKYLKASEDQNLGTYKQGLALIVKKKELPLVPEPGETVNLEDIKYSVIDVDVDNLSFNIYLERVEG